MSWNYRILAHEYNKEIYFEIHEVYYNKDGKPDGYTAEAISVGGEDMRSITWILNKMKGCREKPILWSGDKFPNEYK